MSLNRSVVRSGFGALAVVAVSAIWPARPAAAFCGFFVAGSDAKLTNNASQVVLMRKGQPHGHDDVQHATRGRPRTSRWWCRCRSCCRRRTSRRCPPTCSTASTRCRRRGWSSTGSRTPASRRMPPMPAPAIGGRWHGEPAAAPSRKGRRPGRQGRGAVRRRRIRGRRSCRRRTRGGLETWLRQEKYNIPQGAAAALAPYVRDKSKFFVAKVDIKKVKRDAQGVVQLSPLRFRFDANELRLPVRLGCSTRAASRT